MTTGIEIALLLKAITAMKSSHRKTLKRGSGQEVSVPAADAGPDWGLSFPVFGPDSLQLTRLSQNGKDIEFRFLPIQINGDHANLPKIADAMNTLLRHPRSAETPKQ